MLNACLQIAVITPYNAQVQLLRAAFEAQPEIEIGSGV
jgi:superfamily I DNA and/or RNA helicase